MPVIDMSTLKPVGEFGSKAWGEGCSDARLKYLRLPIYPRILTGRSLKITHIHLPDS